MAWGVWGILESDLQAIGEVRGRDVLEFGCGGAQWAIALAKRGARVVGLDLSEGQLSHAQKAIANQAEKPSLVHASGEFTPFRDDSFDLVFCDHGAMTFARPEFTVPEAARLLRPGGRLVFNIASPFIEMCWDNDADELTRKLQRAYFGLHRGEDGGEIYYQLPYGEWIRLFRKNGLRVDDLIEIQPPEDAETTYTAYAPLDWARRWPAESLWIATKES